MSGSKELVNSLVTLNGELSFVVIFKVNINKSFSTLRGCFTLGEK